MANPTPYVPLSDAIAMGIPIAVDDPWGAEWLAAVAIHDALTESPRFRARKAEEYRRDAAYIAEHGQVERISSRPPITGEEARQRGQHYVWAADVLDDPSLSPALCDLLPAEAVGPQLAKLHKYRSPHPLVVDWFDSWSCQACNAHHDDGAVGVRIGEHEDYSESLEYPLIYCPDCIAMAATAIGADA